jgi:hypothetical protein
MRPVAAADVARELTSRTIATAMLPLVADMAGLAAEVWSGAVRGANGAPRRRATMAVIDTVYPLAAAGERGGTQAVAQHIVASAARAAADLGDSSDPGRAVRDLLGRLSLTAHTEGRFGYDLVPRAAAHPLTTSYVAVLGDLRDDTEAQRAATAATVAWTHGYRDGWQEAYWSANRIINTVRYQKAAATTVIDGIPGPTWIDDRAESVRQIACERPNGEQARLTGSSPLPSATDNAGAAPTHRSEAIDKGNRRPRGM